MIIGTCVFSWIVAALGGGLGWLLIVLGFTFTSYRLSISRMKRNSTDDVAREAALKRIETDSEKLEWLNSFLVKFWVIYEPVLSETVIGVANQVLAGAAPGFVESLSLQEFTLGTKPPRVEGVRSYPLTEPDEVHMDWRFSFQPKETSDMTARQIKEKKNPKVVLSVRIGKGVISKGLPILVEDMSFSGLMRVRIKLIPTFPHVKTVDVSFLQPPDFDFVLKPIGGDTLGFDINVIPGLESFIRNTVHANLGPMLYEPATFQINVEEMMAAAAPNAAIGVLAITVFSANGLKGTESIGNTIDPYVTFSVNDDVEVARTEIKMETKNPRWNETKYILVNKLSDIARLTIWDFNDFRKDKVIGVASLPLDSLATKPDQTGVSIEILDNGKSHGTLDCELHWLPVLEHKTLEDGTIEPPAESNTGILRFITHQCKDLDATKSLVGQLSPYSDLLMNGNLLHQSHSLKRTNNPVWEDVFEFLVTDKSKCNVGVRVKDSRGLATDPIIGTYNIQLDNLLAEQKPGGDWYNLTPSGRVRVEALWKPIALKGAAASKNYMEPIGSLRIHVMKAGEELRNLETIGKVDPYIRVFLNGFQRGRTVAIDSTLAPNWDEIIYVPVQRSGQRLVIEAMDAENLGQDRSLGQFELNTAEFIKENEAGEYVEFVDNQVRCDKFSMAKKGTKGSLLYTVSFYPSVPVMNPDVAEELRVEAEKKAAEAAAAAEKEAEENKDKKQPIPKELPKEEEEEEKPEGPVLKDIPLEELVKNETGISAITFLDAEIFDTDLFIRVLVDDGVIPTYSTPRIAHKKKTLGETGELIIREIEFSQLTFQLTSKVNKPKKDEIISNFKINTLDLLKKSYKEPYLLNIKSGTQTVARATVRMRYFPLLMQLDPSESVNNMGVLTGTIVKADNVPAADRSGYSDPYTNVILNGEKIFKTKTVKKTLNPVWNEPFSCEILSRTASKFKFEVFDWDMGPGDDDFLGEVGVDLAQLEPFTPLSLTLPLKGKSGTLTVNLQFKPAYIARRIDSSGIGATFANGAAIPGKMVGSAIGSVSSLVSKGAEGTGDIAGGTIKLVGATGQAVGDGAVKIVGGASQVVGGGIGLVGSGVKSGASRLKMPFGRKHKDQADTASIHTLEIPGAIPAAGSDVIGSPQSQQRSVSMMSNASSMPQGDTISGEINISYATGFNGYSSLQVRAFLAGKREKEVFKTKNVKYSGTEFKFDETFSFTAPTDAQYIFKVREHRPLGIGGDDLGEILINIADQSANHPITLPVKDKDDKVNGELTILVGV